MGRCTCPSQRTTVGPLLNLLGCAAIAVLLATLGGCSASSKKPGSYGRDSFTFEAELPKDFGITVKPHYHPIDPSKCQAMSFATGKNFTRTHGRTFTGKMTDRPYTYSLNIPLTYQREQCPMELTNIVLEINGRFGTKDWQSSYGRGGLEIVDNLPANSGVFKNGKLDITGHCRWTFHQSKARSHQGEVVKLLHCTNAGSYLKKSKIAQKKVKLSISINTEDTPSFRETWIKHPEGWKPCSADGNRSWCKPHPTFQTFKMNGKTCTVYPNCTEQTNEFK